jgi:hypothetical protein
MVLLYLSFDWLPFFGKNISEVIAEKYNLEIVDNNNEAMNANASNFIEKHISDVLNSERKNINRMSHDNCGITYTITRHSMAIAGCYGNNWRRAKKYFYPWMVLGDLVSFFVMTNI